MQPRISMITLGVKDVAKSAALPAQKTFWGGYSGYIKDPDGHLWEIAHNPFFWVGPEDAA